MNDENIFTYQLSPVDGKIESIKVETIELPKNKDGFTWNADLIPGRAYCYRLASE